MLLAREFIDYVSRQVVRRLSPVWVETTDPQVAADFVAAQVADDLSVEDRLNEEVREMLSQYSEYMRREGVSYQDMFRKIKNTLITQRKVIRAAGRDTGDSMKLSRDKINDLLHGGARTECGRNAQVFQPGDVGIRDDAPQDHQHILHLFFAQQLHEARADGIVGP